MTTWAFSIIDVDWPTEADDSACLDPVEDPCEGCVLAADIHTDVVGQCEQRMVCMCLWSDGLIMPGMHECQCIPVKRMSDIWLTTSNRYRIRIQIVGLLCQLMRESSQEFYSAILLRKHIQDDIAHMGYILTMPSSGRRHSSEIAFPYHRDTNN